MDVIQNALEMLWVGFLNFSALLSIFHVLQAKTYVEYKIGVALHEYMPPICVIVGGGGNILAVLVMLQHNNRRISSCIYMAILAISDQFVLGTFAFYW